MRFQEIDINKRFWEKVKKTESCWLWTGAQKIDGYGTCYYKGTNHQAHRVSWELLRGPIAPGLFVLHECDNPPCVNPEHLKVGTQKQNMQDCARRGRLALLHKHKPFCSRGHRMEGENLKVDDRGHHICRECCRIRNHGRYRKNKARWDSVRAALAAHDEEVNRG